MSHNLTAAIAELINGVNRDTAGSTALDYPMILTAGSTTLMDLMESLVNGVAAGGDFVGLVAVAGERMY